MHMLQLIFISGNFYFSFVSTLLAYINFTLPKNKGKRKITWDKKLTAKHTIITFTMITFFWTGSFSFVSHTLIS